LPDPGGQSPRHFCRSDDQGEEKEQLQELGHRDTRKLYVRIAGIRLGAPRERRAVSSVS
jgi:hypothetical protein